MNKRNNIPYTTIIISIATILCSLYVNHEISGTSVGKVRIIELEKYGGFTWRHLMAGEFWRLLTAQLIHVKQLHMFYNVLSFALLGVILEKYIGSFRFFVAWFISGTLGTLFSTFTVEYPWNLGTGASQAIFGIIAIGLIIVVRKVDIYSTTKLALAFAFIPAIMLDIMHAHHPKLGHIVGFIIGLCFGIYFASNGKLKQINNTKDIDSNGRELIETIRIKQ